MLMTFVVDVDDITAWSRALRTGNIFAGFVHVSGHEFHPAAGITAVASDTA
jgi:hypothetical protein